MTLIGLSTALAIGAMFVVLPAATAASAEPQCIEDPADTPRESLDFVRVCATYGADSIDFRFVVRSGENPEATQRWIDGDRGITASMASSAGEYRLEYLVIDGRLTARITHPSGEPGCVGAASQEGNSYLATGFPPSCIGSPAAFRFVATSHDGPTIADTAPDRDFATISYTGDGEAPPGGPTPNPTGPENRQAERLSGPGRIDTAVEISKYQFPAGAPEVYLANAATFPDALAGSALTQGPILLVPQCGDVPRVVLDEVARLQPAKVVALGGQAAVCDAVLSQARAAR
jgi:hypothetical protein